MRNVDLKEIGNPESAVYSNLLNHSQGHSKSLCDELGKLLNTPKLELSCCIKNEFHRPNANMVFEVNNLLFTVYLSESDLNNATLLHLGATPSQDSGTPVRFTNSHTHILRRIGTVIGFFLFAKEPAQSSNETEQTSRAIEFSLTIESGLEIKIAVELDNLSANRLFDDEIAKQSSDNTEIAEDIFNSIELNLSACIGLSKLPLSETSKIRVGSFIPLTDTRNKAEIKANGTTVGTGEYIELENNSQGIKLL